MPKHTVTFSLPNRELGKEDIIFSISEDGEKIGTITISKGAIEWYPAKARRAIKLSWTQFDRLMQSKSLK